ncbi:MAG TPA: FAD-dependent oxidoreductase, partial [Firmicutes bacterium]|nr:FAD-dependent oxidoreductase [Bacillota bacterium]
SGGGVVGLRLQEGDNYEIPYRCLVPLGCENLLLAGRCISVSHIAFGSVRIMPIASCTGHAAGAAAAICVKRGVSPRNLDYSVLLQTLLDQGANLR